MRRPSGSAISFSTRNHVTRRGLPVENGSITFPLHVLSLNRGRAHRLRDDLRCHGYRVRHLYDLGPRGTDPRREPSCLSRRSKILHSTKPWVPCDRDWRRRSGCLSKLVRGFLGPQTAAASEAGRLLRGTPNCVFGVDRRKDPQRLIDVARRAGTRPDDRRWKPVPRAAC
jgi:hypothetical protein